MDTTDDHPIVTQVDTIRMITMVTTICYIKGTSY